MKKLRYITLALCLGFPLISWGNISSDLGAFFNSLGYSSNVTDPQVYQGQSAGYYTGGSLFARNSVRNIQLASVDLPSFRGGCGGIDLFTGGFSFINSQQLQAGLKNIANNGLNYAFMLGVKSVSPMIANTMQDFQTWANRINNTNINSCQAGAALVGSVWPKTDVAQQNVCQSIGTESGIFGDYAAARQGCGSGGQRSSVMERGKTDARYQAMVLENTNIAWQAIQKNAFLASDNELSELFLSLSGTIIVKHEGGDIGKNHFAILTSLASNRQLIQALLRGGKAKIYHCDESNRCLNPTLQTITIQKQNALGERVHVMLKDMINHIYNDTPLTKDEIGLLQATPAPIYKMLNVQAAYLNGTDLLDVNQLSDLVASSLLFQYINESLHVVRDSAGTLQYPQEILSQFMQGINQARAAVSEKRDHTYKIFNQMTTLIERTQTLEKQLAGRLSERMASNLQWEKGMR